MSKCKIDEIVPLGSKYEPPILAHFQNGRIPPNCSDLFDCFLAKDTDQPDCRMALAVSSENVFDGQVLTDRQSSMRNFIAIRNKSTNKIRLVEVEESSMLSQHYGESANYGSGSNRTKNQAYKLLLSNFGGKRAASLLERKERMKINVDIVKDQLDKTVVDASGKIDVDTKDNFDLSQAEREQHLESMVPPMNKEAKRLNEVYRLTDLIPESLLNRLDSEAMQLLQTKIEEIPIETKYLLDIIGKCQEDKEPDSKANLTKIKIVIYLDALINFVREIRRRYVDMRTRPFSKITQKVETCIRHRFSQPESIKITKTPYIINKVISYVLVLSLLCSEKNELDLNLWIEAVQTSRTALLKLYSVVAVRLLPASDILALKLPSSMRAANGTFQRKKRQTM